MVDVPPGGSVLPGGDVESLPHPSAGTTIAASVATTTAVRVNQAAVRNATVEEGRATVGRESG